MGSPKVNLKTIPLFRTLFESDSVNFKEDRLWILQLLYAGLNASDDAKIYKRNGLFELLLSFYVSSLSDEPSRFLILQIIQKSVKINMLIHYLVKECGLLSWLACIISKCGHGSSEAPKGMSVKTMELVLKVIDDVNSKGAIADWLLEHALEQLSAISALLQSLIVDSPIFFMHDVPLLNSVLHVIISALRISQKRRVFQPHFTISNQGLFQLCKALDFEFCNLKSSLTFELGINTILMSSPPPARTHMDRVRLRGIVVWAISCALQVLGKQDRIPDCEILVMPEEQEEETLLSKLLRWLTASVILGVISKINPTLLSTTGDKSLKFILKNILEQDDNRIDSDDDDGLTDLILHLLLLLGKNCRSLISAVSALSLLQLQAPNRTRSKSPELDCDIEDLCSKVDYPPEANPSWRWSYYQAWKDYSLKRTMVEQMQVTEPTKSLP